MGNGVWRSDNGVLSRLIHHGPVPVVVRVAQNPSSGTVHFGAWSDSDGANRWAVDRMRFALGVDDDLEPFCDRFRDDPLIGVEVRRNGATRPMRTPYPFEALAWAITGQLIEWDRAARIQRRIVRRLGRSCSTTGLRDVPTPDALSQTAPALLAGFDLAPKRAVALVRVSREVAQNRIDLGPAQGNIGLRRLRSIPEIGPWTVEKLASEGQGRYDMLPAGDLMWLKLVGRLKSANPKARATEDEVREFFAPYAPWQVLAAHHMVGASRYVDYRTVLGAWKHRGNRRRRLPREKSRVAGRPA